MPQFLSFLQQWGPWIVLVIGVSNLIMSIFFHRQIVRLLRHFYASKFVTDKLDDPQLGLFERQILKWGINWSMNWVDHPWVWRFGIVYGCAVTVGGLAWLFIRGA
ncbi:MAG: hypothetical protein JWN70_1917 [Planctomycetaceae bacterium]|nr:hypothetical protein [Planctomycetaceae bacterium]